MTRQVGTIPTTGIGGPDYEQVVAGSKERRGIFLGYGQVLKVASLVFAPIPSFYPWVVPALIPGATQHLIDVDTGLPTPFIVPQGYVLTVIAVGASLNEDGVAWIFMDTGLVLCGGFFSGGYPYFENKLAGVSTASVDPTGAATHAMDVTITNNGLGDMQGTIDFVLILQKVGSPPLPTVKTVRCRWCGHEHEVPNSTTDIICPKCGKLFTVYDLSKMRRTP